MDLTGQTTDNELVLPSTIYMMEDFENEELPSSVYPPGELWDTPPLPDMISRPTSSWDLEEFGYTCGITIVHQDGKMQDAQQLPEYYVYSPVRSDAWEEGIQAIEEFDWALNEEEQEQVEITHASATEPITDRYSELANVPRHQFDYQDAKFSQDPQLPKLPKQETDISYTLQHDRPSPPRISSQIGTLNNTVISGPEYLHGEVALASAVETEAEWDSTTTTNAGVEIESQRTPMTVASDSRHANGLPVRDSLLPDFAAVDEPRDNSTQHHVVRSTLVLVDDTTEKAHGIKTLPETPQNDIAHAQSLHTPYNLPAHLSDLQTPSTATLPQQLNLTAVEAQHVPTVHRLETQSQEGRIKPVPASFLTSFPPGYVEIERVGEDASSYEREEHAEDIDRTVLEENSAAKTMLMPMSTLSNASEEMETEQTEGGSAVEDRSRDLPSYEATMQIVLIPTKTETSTTVDKLSTLEIPLSTPVTADPRKRSRPTRVDPSSDSEGETPAKKRTKARGLSQATAIKLELISSDVEEIKAPLPVEAPKRPTTMKSPKEVEESNEDISKETLGTKRRGKKTSKPPGRKAVSKEAQIYFEEDIRPAEDGSATILLGEDGGDEPLMDDDDYDMQEHLSDVHDSLSQPSADLLHTPLRAPRHNVSDRELASLGSTLAPGMHLGLHLYTNAMPARVWKPTGAPIKSSITDKSFLIVEDDTPEPDSSSVTKKGKRDVPTISKKTPAPKKTKIEPPTRNDRSRAASEAKTEQRSSAAAEASDEDELDLFSTPMIDVNNKSTAVDASTPLPKRVVSQEAMQSIQEKKSSSTKEKIPVTEKHSHPATYSKRLTRGNAKLDASRSASPAATGPVVQASNVQGKTSIKKPADDTDEEYIESPTPPKITKKKTHARSALLKSVSTPSTTSTTASSPPAKNKFGFKPRNTRSRVSSGTAAKTPSTSKAKGKVSTFSDRGAAKSKNGNDGNPAQELSSVGSTRTTRRASALEMKDKEENIGKRLRSKD